MATQKQQLIDANAKIKTLISLGEAKTKELEELLGIRTRYKKTKEECDKKEMIIHDIELIVSSYQKIECDEIEVLDEFNNRFTRPEDTKENRFLEVLLNLCREGN